jgi:hypothetical protein
MHFALRPKGRIVEFATAPGITFIGLILNFKCHPAGMSLAVEKQL